jgi:hypothetical protein
MVTSSRSVEECSELVSQTVQRLEPRGQQRMTLRRQRVRALRRPGELGAPLGLDQPVLLEGAQRAVDVAHVDPLLTEEVRKLLKELVPVGRSVREQHEERRLAKPFDPCADVPALGRPAARAAAMASAVVHDPQYM